MNNKKCGYVALIGRPNVGKSTLLNSILGQKVSIVSHKAQTTQSNIWGIKTNESKNAQAIYIDPPGIHSNVKKSANKRFNAIARRSLEDIDLIIFITDSLAFSDEDEKILQMLRFKETPIILLLNKIDRLKDKTKLLPFISEIQQKLKFTEIIPICALNIKDALYVEQIVEKYLPEGEWHYTADQITNSSDHFICSEIIREKIFHLCHEEIPYEVKIDIKKFEREGNLLRIDAIIKVPKPGQKAILIGNKGSKIKEIGIKARADIENNFSAKVMLKTLVESE